MRKSIHASVTHSHTHTSFSALSPSHLFLISSSLLSPYSLLHTQLERHLAMKGGDCPLAEVDCPFKVYGCSFVVRSSTKWSLKLPLGQALSHHKQEAGFIYVNSV